MKFKHVVNFLLPQDTLFSPSSHLEAWQRGEHYDTSGLRFGVGDRVECRIGSDPVTGWGAGSVIKTVYREANWPEEVFAPYQVKLDDGRLIFAPHDLEQVIRAGKPAEDGEDGDHDYEDDEAENALAEAEAGGHGVNE